MFSSLNWYEAATRERKMAFGLMTIAAFGLVFVLGNTILWGRLQLWGDPRRGDSPGRDPQRC
jgi:hypothetical protein